MRNWDDQSRPATGTFQVQRPSRKPRAVSSSMISLRLVTYTCNNCQRHVIKEQSLRTVRSVTFWRSVLITSGSSGDSMSSDRSSTARSRSLVIGQARIGSACYGSLPLVIFEQLLLIAGLQVVCHSVSPHKCCSALDHFVYSFLHELDLDPRELRRNLHLLHLLLCLRVQLDRELLGLLVIGPTIVVLYKGASPQCHTRHIRMYVHGGNARGKLGSWTGHREHPYWPSRHTDCSCTKTCHAPTTGLCNESTSRCCVTCVAAYPCIPNRIRTCTSYTSYD